MNVNAFSSSLQWSLLTGTTLPVPGQ